MYYTSAQEIVDFIMENKEKIKTCDVETMMVLLSEELQLYKKLDCLLKSGPINVRINNRYTTLRSLSDLYV